MPASRTDCATGAVHGASPGRQHRYDRGHVGTHCSALGEVRAQGGPGASGSPLLPATSHPSGVCCKPRCHRGAAHLCLVEGGGGPGSGSPIDPPTGAAAGRSGGLGVPCRGQSDANQRRNAKIGPHKSAQGAPSVVPIKNARQPWNPLVGTGQAWRAKRWPALFLSRLHSALICIQPFIVVTLSSLAHLVVFYCSDVDDTLEGQQNVVVIPFPLVFLSSDESEYMSPSTAPNTESC
mmetsp:Transcript_18118/g.31059  ORF Transcript_18118/g.31059 Transcript_18118/m.31059 type:complete len:236 (-) Transcript_18118:70-777(-)